MRLRQAFVLFAMAAGIVGGAAGSVRAFEVRAHDALADLATRQTTFTVAFSDPPDFFTALGEEVGTERNAFQYFIDVEPLIGDDPLVGPDVSVVRGPEIRFDPHRALRIRATEGPDDGDPANGGWGPLRGAVPYQLDGDTLRFTVAWDVIGDTDGSMAYIVETYEDGTLTSSFAGSAGIILPLPPGAWTGLSVLAGIVGVQYIRGRRARNRRSDAAH